MRKFCFLIPLLSFFSPVWMAAQLPDTLLIRFSQELMVADTGSYGLPESVRHLGEKHQIHTRSFSSLRFRLARATHNSRWIFVTNHVVVPQALKGDTALGYVTMYYEGNNRHTPVKNNFYCLVQHPRAANPVFYPDLNGNLDFTDDGAPVPAVNGVADFRLPPAGKGGIPVRRQFVCRHAGSIAFWHKADSMRRAQAGNKIFEIRNPDKSFGLEHSATNFRLTTRYADTVIAGMRLQFSVSDNTDDGLFNAVKSKKESFGDSFRMASPEGKWEEGKGAYQTDPVLGKVIRVGTQNYALSALSPTGDWVRLVKSSLPPDGIVLGGNIPPFSAEPLAGGKAVPFASVKDTTRYTLIDVWGSWCGGCVFAMPTLKRIDSLYRGQLQIIGIAEDDPKRALAFEEKYHTTWPQLRATDEILKLLEVEGFPSYILLDPKGQIVKPRIWPADVEVFLQELVEKKTEK